MNLFITTILLWSNSFLLQSVAQVHGEDRVAQRDHDKNEAREKSHVRKLFSFLPPPPKIETPPATQPPKWNPPPTPPPTIPPRGPPTPPSTWPSTPSPTGPTNRNRRRYAKSSKATNAPSSNPSNMPNSIVRSSVPVHSCKIFSNATTSDIESFCSQFDDEDKCCTDINGIVNVTTVCSTIVGAEHVQLCKGACQGDNACNGIGRDSSSLSLEFGINACQGSQACKAIALSAETTILTILDEACQGYTSACYGIGLAASGDFSLDIGLKACSDSYACMFVSSGAVNPVVRISEDACIGEVSCRNVGNMRSASTIVKQGSCKGENACYDLGNYQATSIDIGKNSCIGTHACLELGLSSLGIDIGQDACVGTDSCKLFGRSDKSSPEYVKIWDSGCVGNVGDNTRDLFVNSICKECMRETSALSTTIPFNGDCSDVLNVN